MITYDGLRVLMMAEDDSRCCFGLFGPLFQPKIMKIRQYACFFKARLMVMSQTRRNIARKQKNNEKLNLKTSIF